MIDSMQRSYDVTTTVFRTRTTRLSFVSVTSLCLACSFLVDAWALSSHLRSKVLGLVSGRVMEGAFTKSLSITNAHYDSLLNANYVGANRPSIDPMKIPGPTMYSKPSRQTPVAMQRQSTLVKSSPTS